MGKEGLLLILMPIYARALDLKDDPAAVAAYLEYHRHPWPEVLVALRAVGVREMRIFLLGKRLFMCLEGEEGFDPARDLPRYLDLHPRCREWEERMSALQQPLPEARPGEKWAPMEEIFCLSQSL
jgi:L-rhamnose mutarotase